MRVRDIHVRANTEAKPATVYRLLADGSSWTRWSSIDSFVLEQAGEGSPEGVGAVRRLKRGRTTGRDQILELVPDRSIKYASVSSLPVRDYVGEVELDRAPEGWTSIHWHSSFSARIPGTGWIIERGIRRFLEQCTRGLADFAGRRATQTQSDWSAGTVAGRSSGQQPANVPARPAGSE